MKNAFKWLSFTLIAALVVAGLSSDLALAKKKKTDNPRIKYLSGEDKELYEALTKKQRKKIAAGQVELGYNKWMAKLALGEPYYTSEHHPIYKDFEEIWLYTKPQVDQEKSEKKIMDPATNWPTKHKFTRIKRCTVGDFFLLFDRGVIEKIVKDRSKKIYGSCTVETQEEFIPIK